jgi:hypothetical protein
VSMDPLRPTSPAPADPTAEQPPVPGSPWARPDGAADGDATTAVPAVPSVPTAPVGQPQTAPGAAVTMAAAPVPPTASAMPIAPPAKRRSSGRWLNVVLAIAACIAIGGVAFAIGRGTASASTASGNNRGGFITNGNGNGQRPFGSFAPGGNGGNGFIRGGFGGGGGITLSGTVESVTADSITIKTANGQTVTIGTGASTTYHTQTPATASDVTTGKTVQVQLGFNGARGNGGNGGGANGGNGGPAASGAPAGPLGTADSITVVP